MWGLITDEYRLVSIDAADDTVRTITRAFSALPVTALDRERARSELAWFEERGGTIDWSMLPATKPVVRGFFMGDDGGIWVEREPEGDETGALYDVFDPEGRYLGEVTLPFAVELTPPPRLRDAFLHGVIRDELDVQYAVRYRIVKGG
jgi:hypothetical protein